MASKGILLPNGSYRSLESEARRDAQGKIIYPASNEQGEILPYLLDGVLHNPTSVSEEFKWWDSRKESRSFCFDDVLRYVGAGPEDWKNYGSSPNYPQCRECPHGRYASENFARMTCDLDVKTGSFFSGDTMCRMEFLKKEKELPDIRGLIERKLVLRACLAGEKRDAQKTEESKQDAVSVQQDEGCEARDVCTTRAQESKESLPSAPKRRRKAIIKKKPPSMLKENEEAQSSESSEDGRKQEEDTTKEAAISGKEDGDRSKSPIVGDEDDKPRVKIKRRRILSVNEKISDNS